MRRCFPLLLLCLLLIGCTRREIVQVVDAAGTPIAGAQVYAVSPSIDSGPNLTDASGRAPVPDNPQGTQWIRVEKTGYVGMHIPIPTSWPLRVTLTPGSGSWPGNALLAPASAPATLPGQTIHRVPVR